MLLEWIDRRRFALRCATSYPTYKDRVVAAKETDAAWSTGVFDEGFPHAPVRTLDNSTLHVWREAGSPASGARPGEGQVVASRTDGRPVIRYDFAPPVAGMSGDMEAMANYAGQSVGVVRQRQPAGDIVREVAAEAERVLGSFAANRSS